MASTSHINPNNEYGSKIPDFPSKIPRKFETAKGRNAKKLNLQVVCSTPMNPSKRAQLFDESNQLGSPIRSGSSTTDTNGSPNNQRQTKIVEYNTRKTMLTNQEQTLISSPFPYITKLAVKKMTICASEDDSDDDIFVKPKSTKTNTINSQDEKNSDEDLHSEENKNSDEIHPKNKETILKSQSKKMVYKQTNIDRELFDSDSIENTKTVKRTTYVTNKSITKHNKSKSIEIDKENVDTAIASRKNSNKSITKVVSPKVRKLSSKQQKMNENAEQVKKANENHLEDESKNTRNIGKTVNKKSITKLTKSSIQLSVNCLRKSNRVIQPTVPYWTACPSISNKINLTNSKQNLTKNSNSPAKRTWPEDIIDDSLEIKKKPKSKSQKSESKKDTIIAKKLPENTTILNKSKSKLGPEKRRNKQNSFINEELPEKPTTLNRSKSNVQKVATQKDKISKLKNPNDNGIEINLPNNETLGDIDEKFTRSKKSVNSNENRQYSKKLLDKQNKEKKNKIESRASKSTIKSNTNLNDSMCNKYTLEDEVFATNLQDDEQKSPNVEEKSITKSSEQNKLNLRPNNEVIKSPTKKITKVSGKNRAKSTSELIKKQTKKVLKSTRSQRIGNSHLNEKKKVSNKLSEKKNIIENKAKSKISSVRSNESSAQYSSQNAVFETDNISSVQTNNFSENEMSPTIIASPPRISQRVAEKNKNIKKVNKTTLTTPGLVTKNKQTYNKAKNKVNLNVDYSSLNNDNETDSSTSYENKIFKVNDFKHRKTVQFKRPKQTRYKNIRKTLFYKPDTPYINTRSSSRRNNYLIDDTNRDESESESSEQAGKKRKLDSVSYIDLKKRKVDHSCNLKFKERALAVQVPMVTKSLTEIKYHGRILNMECFGNFPRKMTRTKDESFLLRGKSFINDLFTAGVMEIELGTMKKSISSTNHTYFVILDGIAEVGIGNSSKIMRIGDCCVVPKSTFYYIANASSEINLLINFLKITM